MSGLPVDLILLRGLLPDLPVREGDVLPGRVLGPGLLSLGGVRVPASLPAELAAGMRLRLRVEETGPQRIALRVVDQPAPAPEAPAAAQPALADPLAGALRAGLAVGLPGGAVARLFVDPEAQGEARRGRPAGPHRVTLRYEAAAMGRVDVALELLPGAVAGTVHAPAGVAAERLRAAADELRGALAAATGRPATVAVRERDETVDLRA